MTLVVPDVGERTLLEYMLNKTSPTNAELHLFVSDTTPDENTILGTLTECIDASYASITLAGAGWTVATVANITTASFATQTFSFTLETDVYGYYVSDGGTNLLWLERFSGAPVTVGAGEDLDVTPKITGD